MIEINNLAFSYGKNPVLDNITMTLKPGCIYGLLGENGVDKTAHVQKHVFKVVAAGHKRTRPLFVW